MVSQTWNLKLVGNPTDSFTSAQELNLNPNFAVWGPFGPRLSQTALQRPPCP